MTVSEFVGEVRRFMAKYPKPAGEKPLTLLADIDDAYLPVVLGGVSNTTANAGVHFTVNEGGGGITANDAAIALEGLPVSAPVYVSHGGKRLVVAIAVHQKQALVLLTQKL